MAGIGLAMAALSPFVPRVHEQQPLVAAKSCQRRGHDFCDPVLEYLRGRPDEHGAFILPAGGIVPARHDAAEQLELVERSGERLPDQGSIARDQPAEYRIDEVDPSVEPYRVVPVRRKLDASVETESSRMG